MEQMTVDSSAPIRFANLARFPEVRHGVFTREGGFSRAPFASLNLARSVGDDPELVTKNRSAVAAAMGPGRLCMARQVHGTDVRVVGEETEDSPPTADALATDRPGRWLTILVADCQPVLLYAPDRGVVAAIHSGWRGSVGNIIGRSVGFLADHFGVDPAGIYAGIGPSLGPCCAEFIHYRRELPQALWKYKDDGCHFDFWRLSRDQLRRAGVPERQIETAGLCTRCRTDRFYSYRGEKTTGRFAAVIGMRPPA